MYINDPNSTKPADWEEEEMIEDKDATKPEDWDETKEGEWKRPKTKNPNYKGPWQPTKIYNPQYKGIWQAKMIPNPEFKDTPMPSYTIGGIGIDVWQVKSGSLFDNILITDSIDEALRQANVILEKQVSKEKEFKAVFDKEEEAKNAEMKKQLEEQAKFEQEKEQMKDMAGEEKEDL